MSALGPCSRGLTSFRSDTFLLIHFVIFASLNLHTIVTFLYNINKLQYFLMEPIESVLLQFLSFQNKRANIF